MAKIIFDAMTGTVLGLHSEVYIVDTEDLEDELHRIDPGFSQWAEDAQDALSDEYGDAQEAAKSVGAALTNILTIAGQTD